MAAGDSDVSICNKALLLLGAEAISSFSDGTPGAQACNTIYTEVKFSTMGMYPWSFTIAKTQLARDTVCLLYTSPSPRDLSTSRMPSSA